MTNSSSKMPSHRIYAVAQRGEKKPEWREIGAAWAHKDGKGFSLKLDMLPLNGGDIVLREASEKAPQADAEGGAA